MSQSTTGPQSKPTPRPALWRWGWVLLILAGVSIVLHRQATQPTSQHPTKPEVATSVAPAPQPRSTTSRRSADVRLSLRGVAMNANPTIALISVDGQALRFYAVGQEVAPGVVVDEIRPDRVAIRRDGSIETLRLAAAKPLPSEPSADPTPEASDTGLPDPDSMDDDNTDTDDLLHEVDLVSAYGGGFLVRNVTADSIYDRLGLRVGDLVYSLDPLRIIKLEELARRDAGYESKDVQLEVVRGDRRVLLTYDLGASQQSP